MTTPLHSKQTIAEGLHSAIAYEYANAAARTAATGFVAEDINKLARQLDDNSIWVLIAITPTWSPISTVVGFVPTSRTITAGAGLTGGGDLTVDRTIDAVANADGSIVVNANDIQVGILATDAQHGVRGGGTQHANVIPAGAAGFMTGADKSKLDALVEVKEESVSLGTGKTKLNFLGVGVTAVVDGGDPSQINITVPGSGTATIVVKDEGVALVPDKTKLNFVGPGISAVTDGDTLQANITISTASAISITDSTNAEGVADTLARSDHTHAHGSRGGGSLHALVIAAGAAGFMSGTDKTKLDGIASGATNTPLTSTAPVNVTKAAAVVGVSAEAARADHKHDITTAAPAATGVSTASAEGSAASLARSDHSHQSNTAPVNVTKAAAAIGTSGEPARADHKHDITTAAAVNVGDTNAEGSSSSLARADHVHHDVYPILIWGNSAVAATTTTRYLTPGYTDGLALTTAVQFRVPTAGTIRKLRVRHNTTAGNGSAIVYTVRINSVATAVTVSLASTSNDGSDLANTAAIAAGDLIDIEVTKAASVGTSPSDIIASLEVFV